MKRPEGVPRLVWSVIIALTAVMEVYYFFWSRFTKEGRAERRRIKMICDAARNGTLRELFLADVSTTDDLPPDYPSKGRDLLRAEAANKAQPE